MGGRSEDEGRGGGFGGGNDDDGEESLRRRQQQQAFREFMLGGGGGRGGGGDDKRQKKKKKKGKKKTTDRRKKSPPPPPARRDERAVLVVPEDGDGGCDSDSVDVVASSPKTRTASTERRRRRRRRREQRQRPRGGAATGDRRGNFGASPASVVGSAQEEEGHKGTPQSRQAQRQRQQQRQRTPTSNNKRFWTAYRSYRRTLERWVVVDDRLGRAVRSVANLRKRCYETSRSLVAAEAAATAETKNLAAALAAAGADERPSPSSWWKRCGYRHSPPLSSSTSTSCSSFGLTADDLEVTLSDELLRHERMVGLVRRSMRELSQEQDALGRRLDDVLLAAEEETAAFVDAGGGGGSILFEETDEDDDDRRAAAEEEQIAAKAEECLDLYAATAKDLFRKQIVAQELFESTNDAMLFSPRSEEEEGGGDLMNDVVVLEGGYGYGFGGSGSSSHRIAERCADRWSRDHPDTKDDPSSSYSCSCTTLQQLLDRSGGRNQLNT